MTDRTFVAQFTEFLQGKTLTHKEIAGCLGVDKGTISKWTAPHSAIKPRRENIVGLRNCGFSTDEVNQLLLAARYAPLSSQETIFPTGRADIDRYLRRVRERQAILDMSIFQEGQERDFSVVSLEAFYVPLRLAGRPPADEADRSRLRPERQPEAGAELQSNRLLAPDKRPGRHLALVGDAGSGKTTVLRHLAGALARAWLEKDPALAGRQTGLSGDLLLPLFIPLRYYHHFCDVAGPKWAISRGSFLDFLPAYFYDRYGLDLDKTFYRQLLLSGRCLLALDGFDEVPDPGARRQVLEVIRDLADDAEVGRNTIILSSRVAAYGGATQLGGRFQTLWLQNLNREERTRQVKKWVAGITPHTERPLKASDILDRMPEGSSLDQLAVTPMIVTALCVVYFYEHELPEQRAQLYRRCIDIMLHEKLRPGETGAILAEQGGKPDFKRTLLARLAFEMHRVRKEEANKEQAAHWLKDGFRNIDQAGRLRAAYDFLDSITGRGSLLQERSGLFSFGRQHLTFREFLTGHHLILGLRPRERQELWPGLLLDDRWREPIRLAAGATVFENSLTCEAFLEELLDLADNGADPATRLAGYKLAAEALADLGQAGRTFIEKSLQTRIIRGLAGRLTDADISAPAANLLSERVVAARTLGRLGDSREGVTTLPPLLTPPIEGEFQYGEFTTRQKI